MRISIFIDGKNFYSGWREAANPVKINFTKLVNWLATEIKADSIVEANYYTGIEIGDTASRLGQKKLKSFLESLSHEPKFVVKRFPKKTKIFACTCGKEHALLQEKDTDTSIVCDILSCAAKKTADAIVLISGNSTFLSTIELVRELGLKAYVASWDEVGMSKALKAAATQHINLIDGLTQFELTPEDIAASKLLSDQEEYEDIEEDDATIEANNNAFLDELAKAEKKFSGGYIGLNYFLTKWNSLRLENDPDYRKEILDDLVAEGSVEVYKALDGKEAIKLKLTQTPHLLNS